jgi:hypothetical protein
MPTYSEATLTMALTAYRTGEYTSVRKCAYAFNIPASTFANRLTRATSCTKLHESQQILSAAEEKTLLKTIFRLSKSGCPITLLLTRDLAEEIRLSRFRVMSTPRTPPAEHCSLAQQAGQSDLQGHVTEPGEQRLLSLS